MRDPRDDKPGSGVSKGHAYIGFKHRPTPMGSLGPWCPLATGLPPGRRALLHTVHTQSHSRHHTPTSPVAVCTILVRPKLVTEGTCIPVRGPLVGPDYLRAEPRGKHTRLVCKLLSRSEADVTRGSRVAIAARKGGLACACCELYDVRSSSVDPHPINLSFARHRI